MGTAAPRGSTPAEAAHESLKPYRRREPENTLLYQLIERELDQLDASLAAASPYGTGLPGYVRKELAAYIRCGRLKYGFTRLVCRECREEHLVAFSCRGRGICPSCVTRRMQDTALHLVDRVIPRIPMRQWVITFSRQARYHLAADPKLASEALREVLRVIFAYQRWRARRIGVRPARANSNGAISFCQRFNSGLELSLHYHVLIADGVFIRQVPDPDAKPRFIPIAPPTDEEVAKLLDQIVRRVTKVFRKRGRLDDAIDEEPELHLQLASYTPTAKRPTAYDEELPPLCARQDGFSLHAGSAVHANDREGLERLCKYGLRPAFALDRLSEAADGSLLYEMKRTFSDGRRVLRFTPREFLLRICAIIPPRGAHLVKYAGIFSAHSRGRYALTGRGMHDSPHCAVPAASPSPNASPARVSTISATSRSCTPDGGTVAGPSGGAPRSLEPAVPQQGLPNILPNLIKGWSPTVGWPALDGIGGGGPDHPGRDRRISWAELLRRTRLIDVTVCPSCGGRMRVVSVIQDERVAEKILRHLGLAERSPPLTRRGQLPLAFDAVDGVDTLPDDA